MYRTFAMLYPSKWKKVLSELLVYSDIQIEPDRFLGFVLSFSFLLSLAIGFNFGVLFKVKFIENILPDALQLMASNLRAGFTTDRALLLSARPEFGPLKDEINLVGKEITAGKPIEEALFNMTKRVQS